MKKTLAIIAHAVFIGGVSVPGFASDNTALTVITHQVDDAKMKARKSKVAT